MSVNQRITVVIGDAPYGNERPFSALRFTVAALIEEMEVNIFLIENGVYLGIKDQAPSDYPSHENLLVEAYENGANIKACGPCCKARGLTQECLLEGIQMATIHDLVDFVVQSEKTIFF
ncbi:DsrE family protein [Methanolacinia petrolearia DSM 11571]|uniref:DsrE family protein n=1 Tax=Methanolacinia petrolearia (strain DSM 11571 / OCM 486 / SEBR 4847) TaxID=679926 RepID=E1RJH7_METP4|nr:DsrE family protein [Methanolacinia petrolearia]ADN36783.1 DsrE family protein [Methanolacinia petrolearia DSM 11571]